MSSDDEETETSGAPNTLSTTGEFGSTSYVESKQFLRDIVENVPNMIFVKEAEELRFTYINRVGESLLGLDREELMGKNDFDFFPEDQAEFFVEKDREVLRSGRVVDIPRESIDTEHGERILHTKKVPIFDEEGDPAFLLGISEDITERVDIQHSLEEIEQRHEKILETAHEAFVSIDEQGTIIDWNQQAVETFGWERDEAIGRNLADTILPPRYRSAHQEGLETFLETGEGPLLNQRIEVPALHRDGHEFPVELSVSPVEFDDTYTFNGLIHDISDRKEKEKKLKESRRELEEAKLEAERANEAKSKFLARMSHEIRTPMNGVTGMIELLENTELSRRQQEYLELARESANALHDLINDILDLSKIEVGDVELRSVPFALRDTIGDTLQTLGVRASKKDLELTYYVPRDVPDALLGDPGRLRQILVNLTSNSIKFTEEGEIEVRVQPEQLEETEVELRFTVRDTGPGIDPDDRERIFETFERPDRTLAASHRGTGLGLAICAHLVELMGGEIEVESEPGEGSIFSFSAPFEIQEEVSTFPDYGPDALDGMPVLIVDDNATNRRVLEKMVENWGMEPTSVAGGAEALREVEAALETGEPYPIVLLDVVMPEMDGFAVAREILQMTEDVTCHLFMLSSAGNRENRTRSSEVDVADLLTKPVKQSALLDSVTSALDLSVREDSNGEPGDADAERAEQRLRVLVAEDGRVNRRVAIRLLEQRGHEVVAVENGRQAVEAHREQPFDAVLMDVRMPEMDGFEATQEIRARESDDEHIPIIALTAHAMKGDREECLEAGMDEYIPKPISSDDLYETVERLTSADGGKESSSATVSSYDAPFDWVTALERVDGSVPTLRELIGLFVENYPERLQKLQDAVEDRDWETLERTGHTLKGSLEVFAAEAAVDAAARLEDVAEERDVEKLEEAFADLEHELDRLVPAIRERARESKE